MTKEDLRKIFAEATARVYSPETRQKAREKLKREQHFNSTPEDEKLLAVSVELALNRQLFYEVLERILCR